MATIQCLPEEMISLILSYKDITIEDIINFRCTCKHFRYAAKHYAMFMEKKLCQRWSSAKTHYDNLSEKNKQKESEEYEQKRKKFKKNLNFIETSINYVRQLRNYISKLRYERDRKNRLIDNRTDFGHIFNYHSAKTLFAIVHKSQHFMKYSVFIDEINNSLIQSPRRTGCDLNKRYCYEKIYDNIRKYSLIMKWDEFKKLPEREQVLEWTATFVAQSIQLRKNVSYSDVQESLNNIALEVQNYLKKKHPEHSIFGMSAETLSYWTNNNIDNNHWSETEGIQIIDTLNEYIFDKLNFRPCDSEDTNLEYMCINNVLKTKYGQQIILLIIYHSVARRLGLRCDVIVEKRCSYEVLKSYFIYSRNLPTNLPTFPMYCIHWKSTYATDRSENERFFNIISKKFPDCLVDKQFHMLKILYPSEIRYQDFKIISPAMMRQEITMGAMDLTYNFNNSFQINKRKSNLLMKFLIPRIYTNEIVFITRSADVKFAIGTIVTHHNMCEDNCTGVIIGWEQHTNTYIKFGADRKCKATYTEQDVLPLNHCYNQQFRDHEETNYIILTDNNKICYVNEGSISLATPRWINNSEIGRYFCKFENTHYVPNETLATSFSLDIPILTAQST